MNKVRFDEKDARACCYCLYFDGKRGCIFGNELCPYVDDESEICIRHHSNGPVISDDFPPIPGPRYDACKGCPYGIKCQPCIGWCTRKVLGQIEDLT